MELCPGCGSALPPSDSPTHRYIGASSACWAVFIVGGLVEQWALEAGFYTYDRRVWVKDAAWENSRWASLSYRAVDEFEYISGLTQSLLGARASRPLPPERIVHNLRKSCIHIFWKPGITKVDRQRLTRNEWQEWGSRGVWYIPSVRVNDDHEAKFPLELPSRVIRLLTDPDDVVLDCFMGSGATAVAAIQANRDFIGIELDQKYVDLALRNIVHQKLCPIPMSPAHFTWME